MATGLVIETIMAGQHITSRNLRVGVEKRDNDGDNINGFGASLCGGILEAQESRKRVAKKTIMGGRRRPTVIDSECVWVSLAPYALPLPLACIRYTIGLHCIPSPIPG